MAETLVLEKQQPLYLQLKEILTNKIKSGELKPGDRIPSLRRLCAEYQVSDITIRRTMNELTDEGLIYSEHGRGTFIAKKERKNLTVSSKRLALLLPSITEHVYPEILRGAEDVTHERGYSLTICNTDNDPKKQIRYLHKMDEEHVDGLIITPIKWHSVALEHYERLLADKILFVFVNRFIPELKVDHVVADNVLGGYLATNHLIKLGHKRIAYISVPRHNVAEERLEGYKGALEEAGLKFDENLVKFGKSIIEERHGYTGMKEFLDKGDYPQAVFAYNDQTAKEVYEAITEAGLWVPEDVALVGFDNSGVDRFLPISLTTVAYPSYETGALAAKILLDRIEGKNLPLQQHVLKPKLIVRESCGVKLRNDVTKRKT